MDGQTIFALKPQTSSKTRRSDSKKTKTKRGSRSRGSRIQKRLSKNKNYNINNIVSLGHYSSIIYKFFEKYKNLGLIKQKNIKQIGTDTNNGFVLEIPFEKGGLTSYTALKFTNDEMSDNLYYEFCVGKFFVNNYLRKIPCFIETYDLYEIVSPPSMTEDPHSYITSKLSKIHSIDLPQFLQRVDIPNAASLDFRKSCENNKNYCILLQHYKNFTDLYHASISTSLSSRFKYEVQNYIFQAYYCLRLIKDVYTHYDLSPGNIFLYKPYDGKKCILMKYHIGDKIVEFKSEYIVKIIDYGRNFFDNGEYNSNMALEAVCGAAECGENCGDDYGYSNMNAGILGDASNFHWIDASKKNESHDLKAAHFLRAYLTNYLLGSGVRINYIGEHGTPENLDNSNPNLITNVSQFVLHMVDPVIRNNRMNNHRMYDASWETMATMIVYEDGRDYEFIPEK